MAFGQINVTGTAAQVPGSGGQSACTVQNVGSAPVAFGETSSVTYATGVLIYPQQSATFYAEACWLISAGTTVDCRWLDSISA
jgi:hypothetical protein